MSWQYTVTEGRRLRRGYSTGSCAAAAAKAAVGMLYGGITVDVVTIDTPAGVRLAMAVGNIERGQEAVSCSVVKDAGDDPDITDGVLVFARAVPLDVPEILIKAGRGVGIVTRPGLQVPVGKPAINPMPEKMILKEVKSLLPPGRGVEIEISLPDGERLARKTLNARLGVIGGLSILGTTGIVEPMSEKSYRDTLVLELGAMKKEHKGPAVLVSGNYGRTMALEQFDLPPEAVVKIGNLVGFALDRCMELQFKKVLLIGHIGKLIKVTAGIFNTHSRVADARFEIFAAQAALAGAGRETLLQLQDSGTTEEMADILAAAAGNEIFTRLAEQASAKASAYLHGEVEIGTVLFNFRRGLLGMDESAVAMMEDLKSG